MNTTTTITMLNERCDRCGKSAPELHPYKLSETIVYRGKEITSPWLCLPCFKTEKAKWWKEHRA